MCDLPRTGQSGAAAELDQIIAFLSAIGLSVREQDLPDTCVLPVISVEAGALVVDRKKLLYAGDLLHEAGHLAVLPSAERAQMSIDVGNNGGLEMGAIAWSYAAALMIGLAADVVFHDNGYKGGAENLRRNFAAGHSIFPAPGSAGASADARFVSPFVALPACDPVGYGVAVESYRGDHCR